MRYVNLTGRSIDRFAEKALRFRVGLVAGPLTLWCLFWYYDPVPWRLWALGV